MASNVISTLNNIYLYDPTFRLICWTKHILYLAKIALDIIAKHAKDSIGILDDESYREQLWDHQPITDFWRISYVTAKRLRDRGMTTLRHVATMEEDYLYKWFGIDAEILIDHAWGRESTTIANIKNYKANSKSISSSQVLMKDYRYLEGELIAQEMADLLCLDIKPGHLFHLAVRRLFLFRHQADRTFMQ